MIERLNIHDFAIADNAELEFSPGFNVITGETGAGKSIILSAVSMALGDRADQDTIRKGADEAVVEAVFNTENVSDEWLAENGFPSAESVIIKRVLKRNGKNRVFINGSPGTLLQLRALTEKLIDLNNQNEHQMLMNSSNHTAYIDIYGRCQDEFSEYREKYEGLASLIETYEAFKRDEKEIRRRLDNYRFEHDEIDAVSPSPGEDSAVMEEVSLLERSRSIMEAASALDDITGESEIYSALTDEIYSHLDSLKGLGGDIGAGVSEIRAALESFETSVRGLKRSVDGMELDEERLNQVNERLAAMEKLKRKYGDSIEDVLIYRERISEEIDRYEEMTFDAGRFEKRIEETGAALKIAAERLDKKRRASAEEFAVRIMEEFSSIGLEKARFRTVFSVPPGGIESGGMHFGPHGPFNAEFHIETNPGEGFHQLVKSASGGELSRILFALKSVISGKLSVDCMIFDEIDNGIGGEVAAKVARKLAELSGKYQMIVITHQPQIAAPGDRHFYVEKTVSGERTVSRVTRLNGDEHVMEIARMLAGDMVNENAVMMARAMCGT